MASDSLVMEAFRTMSGDPRSAINAARGYSVGDWIAWQQTQVGAAGAAAAAVPGAHLLTTAADVAFVLHKIGHCAWGVGAAMDAPIDADADLQAILAIWSGAISEEVLDAATNAAKLALSASAVGMFGYWVIASGNVPWLLGLAASKAAEAIANDLGLQFAASAIGGMAQKITEKSASKIFAKMSGKLNTKVAAKVGAKLATKSAKFLAGFVPLLGPLVSGGINIYMIGSVGESAALYYRKKMSIS